MFQNLKETGNLAGTQDRLRTELRAENPEQNLT